MFNQADAFNSDISKWNLQDEVVTAGMFFDAKSFNHKWCNKIWDGKTRPGDFSKSDFGMMKCCATGFKHLITSTGIDCVKCPVGTFTTTRYEATCKLCPTGWHQNENGTQFCIPCVPGQTQNLKGQRKCDDCTIGRSMSKAFANVTECDECETGKYQDEEQKEECKTCGKGKWSDAGGAKAESTCEECGAGKYSSAKGASSFTDCTSCPPGKASNKTANTKSSDCIECEGNHVAKVSGSTKCDAVDKGTIVISGGAAVVSKYSRIPAILLKSSISVFTT